MSVTLAEGVVEVKADASDVPRSIARDIDRGQSVLGEAGGRSASAFGGVFKGSLLGSFLGNMASDIVGQIGYAIGSGIRAAVQWGFGSIDLAGSLEQSIGAVDAVFAGNAGTIHGWAATANSDVGLTANAYNELATVLGSQLKNGGLAIDAVAGKTGDLITLGADMSAMFGGTTKDAVGALSAALRGERDTIERYGVSLTQSAVDAKAAELGYEKVGGALSQQATQAATLALIYEQTAAAQGQFAGESDTFAGKQQRLAASFEEIQTKLGTALLPALTTLADFALTNLVPIFDQVIELIGPQLGAALTDAAPAFLGMVEAIIPHIPEFMRLASEALPMILDALGYLVPMGIEIAGSFALGAEQISDFFGGLFRWAEEAGVNILNFALAVQGHIFGVMMFFEEAGINITRFFSEFAGNIGRGISEVGRFVGEVGTNIGRAITAIAELPGQALTALGDLGNLLFRQGQKLIGGFIRGIEDMIGGVGDAIGGVLDFAAGFFPNSPAKRGPFSGSGWTAIGRSGIAIGEQFASGLDKSRFGIPFAGASGAPVGADPFSTRVVSPASGGGGDVYMPVTINEAKDPLGSAGRLAAELRKWKARA